MKRKALFLFISVFSVTATATPTLPCDLSRVSKPRPVLVEEFHDNESSIRFRDELFRYAAQGLMPVASEASSIGNAGGFFEGDIAEAVLFHGGSPAGATLHSIESERLFLIAMNYELQIYQIHGLYPPSQLVFNLVKYAQRFPLLREILLSSLRKPDLPEKTRALAALLETILPDQEFAKLPVSERKADFFRRTGSLVSEEIFLGLMNILHRDFISFVNARFPEAVGRENLPAVFTKAGLQDFGCAGYPCLRSGLFKEVVVDWRDEAMSMAVAEQICRYEGRFPYLFVIVGRNHSDGIYDRLKGLSGGRIKAWQKASFADYGLVPLREFVEESLKAAGTSPD